MIHFLRFTSSGTHWLGAESYRLINLILVLMRFFDNKNVEYQQMCPATSSAVFFFVGSCWGCRWCDKLIKISLNSIHLTPDKKS